MSKNTNRDIWIAGAFAAFSVDLLVYPLDTLKTRIQSPEYKNLFLNAGTNTVNKAALFRGLYQGLGSVIIATLPSSGAFFTTYEGTKHLLSTTPLLPEPLIHATASSLAELVSCAILTPAEVIKQNAQMVSTPSSTSATLQTISRFRSNPLALWRGYTALAGRNLPFTALQFPLFERLKHHLRERRDAQGNLSGSILEAGTITAISAGLAGSLAAVVTTPVDVVKTRIMLAAAEGAAEAASKPPPSSSSSPSTSSSSSSSSPPSSNQKSPTLNALGEKVKAAAANVAKPPSRKGSLDIAREIMAEKGVKGLFRGGALRAVWTMLGSGLYLGTYEGGRMWLGQRDGGED
ncbi:mitochondrial carrier domain-containing protein [Elsinoe ampelina]|uniref:Mitochondrial carrier domain-containing protein n=1 Tax=Elsinoe ampelina TaxID=302913 RepID=A0A6A6GBT6_9PEZI|nr:mitochondrial carrier domain-containing protein [Elsinoe ampelina]